MNNAKEYASPRFYEYIGCFFFLGGGDFIENLGPELSVISPFWSLPILRDSCAISNSFLFFARTL